MARLEPLLLDQDWLQRLGVAWVRANDEESGGDGHDDGASIDFVWETIATKNQRSQHRKAAVLNRLSGAQVPPTVPHKTNPKPISASAFHLILSLVFNST